METFILLTRVAPEAVRAPKNLDELERKASDLIHQDCPDVKWVANYAVLGPYDYLDIFTAPDIATAAKVAAIVRSYGRAHSEIWPATEWQTFKDMLYHLTDVAKGEAAGGGPSR